MFVCVFLCVRVVAEEEAHRQRHSDHHLPGARLRPVLPSHDPLTLPTHLCGDPRGKPQLQIHQVQVSTDGCGIERVGLLSGCGLFLTVLLYSFAACFIGYFSDY